MTILIQPDCYTFVSVAGVRAPEFLQGQLSCNVPEAVAGCLISGTYNTPKGRVISNFMLGRLTDDQFLLRMRADVAEMFCQTLSRYAALSRVKVSIEPLAQRLVILLNATDSEQRPPTPADHNGVSATIQRYPVTEIWMQPERAEELIKSALSWCEPGDQRDLNRCLIVNNMLDVDLASTDRYLPNMLGFTGDGSVHFRKGCYTGQEIIARAHYRGAVKRGLIQLHGHGAVPEPGTEIRDPHADSILGEILMAESSTDSVGWQALGVAANGEGQLAELSVNGGAAKVSVIN